MVLEDIIDRIDDAKAELDALRPIDPETESRIKQTFRLWWNYHSNALEGNQLTMGETRMLLMHGLTAKGKPIKDHLDIRGHNDVLLLLEDVLKDSRPLTETFIREIHEMLLVEPYEVDAITPDGKPTKKMIIPGRYKTSPNNVRTVTGEIFHFSSPEDTPAEMQALLDWFREASEEKVLHPLIIAATFHYKFIRIHPFDDGNGRMARILMNLILMQYGYPPAIIKKEQRENEYLVALREADSGSVEPFIEFIGKCLLDFITLYIKAAKGGDIEEEDDLDKKIKLLTKRLANKESLIKVRDHDSKLDVIYKSLFPLLSSLFKQFIEYDKLFVDNSCTISNQQFNMSANFNLENLEDEITEFARYYPANEYEIKFRWSGFKFAGIDTFTYSTSFNLKFERFKYSVSDAHTDQELVAKLYQEELSSQEIKSITKHFAEKVYNFIENRTNPK